MITNKEEAFHRRTPVQIRAHELYRQHSRIKAEICRCEHQLELITAEKEEHEQDLCDLRDQLLDLGYMP